MRPLFLLAVLTMSVHATPLTNFGTYPTGLKLIDSGPKPFSTATESGFVDSQIYRDKNHLTFYYIVYNYLFGSSPIYNVSLSSAEGRLGYLNDGYIRPDSGSIGHHETTFHFANGITPGFATDWLVIQSREDSFGLGFIEVGNAVQLAYIPMHYSFEAESAVRPSEAPEPGFGWGVGAVGLVMVGARFRKAVA